MKLSRKDFCFSFKSSRSQVFGCHKTPEDSLEHEQHVEDSRKGNVFYIKCQKDVSAFIGKQGLVAVLLWLLLWWLEGWV